MADYYSLLARAVANLPKSSPASTRRAIYDRARKALTNQLRSLKPQLPESDIAREERALDEAVARLEAEFEPAMADVHTLPLAAAPAASAGLDLAEPPPAPPPAPPPPPPPPPPVLPRAPEAPVLRAPLRPAAPLATTLRPPTPRPAPIPPVPPRAPPSPPASGLPSATPLKAPLLGAAEPAAAAQEYTPQSALGPAARELPEEAPAAPPVNSAEREAREPARPMLNDVIVRRKTPAWLWVAGAVAVGFAGSVAVLALLMRPALQDLSVPAQVEPPVIAAPVGQEKTARRVGQTAPETPAPAQTTETSAQAPSPEPSDAPSPATTASAPPSPQPSVATSAPAPAPSVTSPAATIPIASRAAMLVATVADAAKPQISVGTAVWSLLPGPAGQPQALGVKSDIDIPDLKMHASMILRKNFDTSLHASHTIDLRVTFDAGSSIKHIKDIALPLMRRDDPPASDALAGVRVPISENYFLIGLNSGEADVTRNTQELAERNWFDFPMQLDDDRIAKLTFEKGADGEKIIAQALAAWK